MNSSNGVFAQVLVVLPCEYGNGATHTSHDGLSATYSISQNSLFQTTVLAWYSGVAIETETISSGNRLALLYDVVHTAQCPAPSLPAPSTLVQNFETILGAWNDEADEKTPKKLFFTLPRSRPNANLSRSSLGDTDAQKVSFFEILGKKYGFNLGLARAKCYVETSHGLDDYGQKVDRYDLDSDDSDYSEPEQDRELSITRLVDLNGKLISKDFGYDEYSEGVPSPLSKAVIDDGHFDKDRKGRYVRIHCRLPLRLADSKLWNF